MHEQAPDDREPIEVQLKKIDKSHNFDRDTGRDSVVYQARSFTGTSTAELTSPCVSQVGGRMICNVGVAEQKAIFNKKSDGQADVWYDTEIFWKRGPGKQKVAVPNFSKTEGRKEIKDEATETPPKVYSTMDHQDWLSKSPNMKTIAVMGNPCNISKQC